MKIVRYLVVLIFFASAPLSAGASAYSEKISTTITDVNDFVVEIFLWFVFITVAAFVTYFIVNTFIFISNNRQYRHLLSKLPNERSPEEKEQQHRLGNAVKSAETRLILLGAIIGFFTLVYILLSSYLYINPSIRENMWLVIFYGVGILTLIVIVYSITYTMQKMKYASLPEGDLERLRVLNRLDRTKRMLKVLLIIIMSLIMVYIVLLVTIAKGVHTLSALS